MRIAIVDDNQAERRELSERVYAALERRSVAGRVFEYGDGGSFLAAARKERFDLVFLDIYMRGLDGVAAAQTLREFDPDCALVFTTTSTDHALDGYRVRALQYLVKPFTAADVEALFDQLAKYLPMPEKYIALLTTGRVTEKLRLRDILWADNFQHRVHIHTADGGTTTSRMTFSELADQLSADGRFFVCSRGVLVNLEHVTDFDGKAFTVAGTMLPVSRNLAEKARIAFGESLFRRKEEG